MNKKKILIPMLSLGMLLSIASLVVKAEDMGEKIKIEENFECYTDSEFEEDKSLEEMDKELGEYIDTLESQLGEKTYKIAKELHSKLVELDKNQKFDEADEVYEKIDEILLKAEKDILEEDFDIEDSNDIEENFDTEETDFQEEYFDFKEYLKEIKEELGEENYKKILKLNEEIEELDKQEKYEEADALYEEINNILAQVEGETSCTNESCDYQEEKELASYKIEKEDIIKSESVSKEEFEKHKMIWERFKKLIPKENRERYVRLVVMTDGKEGTMGATGAIDEKNQKFELVVDPADSIKEDGSLVGYELTHTLIHEFAHMMTLNSSQLTTNDENSKTYKADEGSTLEKSYLNQFYNKFWKEIAKEHKKIDSEEQGFEFYEKYKDRFVSDYAATNPEEDIAESFTEFVLKGKPSKNKISDQKIKFFYQFDELVKLRDKIRKNI